jgi:polysaccharide export outer membrane protein
MTASKALRMLVAALIFVTAAQQAFAQASAPVAADQRYRVNPGDELEVLVWGEERLQKRVRVLPDGSFTFPLVGQIQAAGRLPAEIETIITQGLQGQYRGEVPEVTVAVTTPAGMQFSVIGRVRNPGTFTTGRYLTVLEALSIAGGPTEFAELGNVIVLRKESGQTRMHRVRLSNILRGQPSAADIAAGGMEIRVGDTVIVP